MSNRFTHLIGSMSRSEFKEMIRKTRYHASTRKMLGHYLVLGIPYSQNEGASRQFVYKKLVELEKKGYLLSLS